MFSVSLPPNRSYRVQPYAFGVPTANELGAALPDRGGRGLFGNSEVWVTETPSPTAITVLRERAGPVPASALLADLEPS